MMELIIDLPNKEERRNISVYDDVAIWEICIHEASHIVMNKYFRKIGLSRKKINDVLVTSTGIGSEVNYILDENNITLTHESLVNNPRFLDPMIMTLLAGYYSYKIIISDCDDWIGNVIGDRIYYYNLKEAVYSTRISDFIKVGKLLNDYKSIDIKENEDRLAVYFNQLNEIFNKDEVIKSIESLARVINENIDCKLEKHIIEESFIHLQ